MNDVVQIVKALAWPGLIAVAVIVFHRPLVDLLSQIARRAKKLSLYNVSVELAALPEMAPMWSVASEDVRKLTSAQVFDSASASLFAELARPRNADYAIVDLGEGREWLTSRLFIFAFILGSITGVRAFVFLENAHAVRKKFVGVCTAPAVWRCLAIHYPWLYEAFVHAAAADPYKPPLPDVPGQSTFSNQLSIFEPSESWRAMKLVEHYVEALQRSTQPPDSESESYLKLGAQVDKWERAHWITGDRLERDLSGCVQRAYCEFTPDRTKRETIDAVLRRKGQFVALVEPDGRFVDLIDRDMLLDSVWAESERSSPAQCCCGSVMGACACS